MRIQILVNSSVLPKGIIAQNAHGPSVTQRSLRPTANAITVMEQKTPTVHRLLTSSPFYVQRARKRAASTHESVNLV